MKKKKVSFRINSDKADALDGLARILKRDRSYLLNQAIDAFLDIQRWQIKHIQTSIKQSDAAKFMSHEEIKRKATSWHHRKLRS